METTDKKGPPNSQGLEEDHEGIKDVDLEGDQASQPKTNHHWECNPQDVEIVTVSIFDRPYRFRSNRPELVREIADLINNLNTSVRSSLPGLPHITDYPAHVAFSLARDLIKSHRELDQLRASQAALEEKVSHLADYIDLSLDG
ncbi:MAG: cell division protein ZapA [Deltaproteobacteria bacterium]|nr:cell division protein ZapA [Deltaproteobacteria bacterium]